ncbi:uncharacterized protein LAJ45_02116 [Morchella importuna]|uniref:uncharacterized protein n=1 Tax=Morchella importuna TaxID=1174673 RepID=UPI001E8E3B7D|nr:uncharacterized protein LAJ45_02116 [Morchella importuna]KAH8154348.1 hypothetical protein LAJ45_02116 [Morchella importuna]
MGGNNAQEQSVLSSQGSYTATDLSRRTDHTSFSIPEDGRPITIQTNRRRKKDADASTTLSGTNTSLLIEYFENGKPNGGSPNRRPSVRVKVTPSAQRRHQVKSSSDGNGLHISDAGTSPRRPSHTQRISLSPHVGEDRLVMGDNRSTSGDHSSITSYNSADQPYVSITREAASPESVNSSPRDKSESYNRRAARRNRSASRSKQPEGYFEKDSIKSQKGARSRSVSREYDIQEEAGLKAPKLGRRRSRSLSRERISNRESIALSQHEKQSIEQSVMEGFEKLGKGRNAKSRKGSQSRGGSTMAGDYLTAPRARSRSRSRDREVDDITAEKNRQRRKASQMEESQLQRTASINNPALLDLVEDAIKRLILPQLNEIKTNNNQTKLSKFDPTVASALLERQADENNRESEMSYPKAPGLGLGPPHSPILSEAGEGVSLVGAIPNGERLEMPDGPNRLDTPETYAETRASILSARSGLPYPKENGMTTGHTPPPPDSEFPVFSELNLPHRASRSNLSERDGTDVSSGRSGEGERALSIASLSSTQSTKLAKQRRGQYKGKGKENADMSNIHENEYWNGDVSKRNGAVDAYFAKVREEAQENALMDARIQDMEKDGQRVFMLGGNPSMRSTPVVPHSHQASVLDAPSNYGMSDVSYRTGSAPALGPSALPRAGDNVPETHMNLGEDDEEINTNPSIIQGPIGHGPDDWKFNPANDHQYNDEESNGMPPSLRSLSPAIQTKDEGYISAANPGMQSPGPMTPIQQMGSPSMGMGAIRGIGLEDDDYYGGHRRMGSGNSHGMPSPLYDSATGRGVDRIQSKDIVALMDHLTVRDAQRNARDTEILVTLVRSAAEMRNSFEDMKKQLESQQRTIVDEVGINTERSVQKVIQGPRPLPPSAPRVPRYRPEEEDDEGPAKKRNVFRRALKGLSMKSSNDLQRIEEMLCTLLTEVEGLKGGQEFYQQSLGQSQSLGANSGYYSGVPSQPSASNRIYQDERPRQSNRITPIEEDAVLRTPPREAPQEAPREVRGGSLPLNTPPETRAPPAVFSNDNTPTKSAEKKTTTSTAVRGFLKKGKNHAAGEASDGSRSDINFWEPPVKSTQAEPLSPYSEGQQTEKAMSPVPPSSRGTDAPINHSNRRSLEVHAPQPRMPYNHQLEAQAQQLMASGIVPNSPNANASVSSLGTFPPLGPGGFSDGKLMSPLAQDAYNQHLQQQGLLIKTPMNGGPPRPPKEPVTPAATVEDSEYPSSEKRKSRHRDENGEKIRKPKKERTEEEKQRRKERKERKEREREAGASSSASRKKSRDLLSPEQEGGLGSPFSARSPSTASRLQGPRPLSSNSNKENARRHRHQSSQDTFGNTQEYETYGGNYR